MTYNPLKNLLGAIPVGGKIAYHLYNIEYDGNKSNYRAKLLRKSKWHPQYNKAQGNLKFLP